MKIGNIKNICPQCHSRNTRMVDYMGISCIACTDCGFDERNLYEVYPEDRASQGEKGKFSPYKAGGPSRTRKK